MKERKNDLNEVEVMNRFQGLVVSIVAHMSKLTVIPFNDLLQEGNIGLLKAIRKYDPEKGTKFITHATWWVRAAVVRAIEKDGRVVRVPTSMQERIRKIQRGDMEIYKEKKRGSGVDGNLVKRTMAYLSQGGDCESTDPRGLENTKDRRDTFNDVSRKLLIEKLINLIDNLPLREKEVARYRFELGGEPKRTFKEIGVMLSITDSAVHLIEKRIYGKLRRQLAA